MSIEDIYTGLLTNSKGWAYYDIESLSLRYEDIFPSSRCLNLIRHILGKGSKDDVKCFKRLDELKPERVQHIVSCFLMGIYLYRECHKIREAIADFLNRVPRNEETDKRFFYIWMLCCLYHDAGYAIEDDEKLMRLATVQRLVKAMFKASSKQHVMPSDITPFDENLIVNYLNYRLCHFDVIDHGIVGGALLYKELCQLRFRKEKTPNDGNYWGKDLERDFLIAGLTIASHNIWITRKSKYNEEAKKKKHQYLAHQLDILITDKPLIELRQHPLLFLLCLADSLEPVKTFGASCLAEIDIQVNNDTLSIDPGRLQDGERSRYVETVKGLKGWLVDKSKISEYNNTIQIKLK